MCHVKLQASSEPTGHSENSLAFCQVSSDKLETWYEYWIPTALCDSYGKKHEFDLFHIYERGSISYVAVCVCCVCVSVYATVTQLLKQTLGEMETIFSASYMHTYTYIHLMNHQCYLRERCLI